MPPQHGDEILSHPVHVIRIELHEQIGRTAGLQDFHSLGRPGHKETGHVASIDGFDEEREPRLLKPPCGITEIPNECRPGIGRVHILREPPGQAIELGTAERRGVLDGEIDTGVELRNTVGMAGNSPLARCPVAGRQIVKNKGLLAAAKCVQDVGGGFAVGKLAFDGREPCAGRGVESLEKGTLREERAQIGGELQSALPGAAIVNAGTLRNISDRSGRMKENR